MLKIGDFSTLSEISIHMLRNYDKIGLLKPAHVDMDSNYRYYAESQLADANRIQALKAMGLGLNTIRDILQEYGDSESLAGYLNDKAKVKRSELEKLKQQVELLESTVSALRGNSNILRYSIDVKTIPQRTAACIRSNISEYAGEERLWRQLREVLEAQHISSASLPYDMAIYHDEGFKDGSMDVEVQKAVGRMGTDTENVSFRQIPAVPAAVLTYEGKYRQIAEMGELIANWVQDNQYEFAGSHFNIYHNSPATESDRGKMVTEVCFPIRKKQRPARFANQSYV